MPDSFENPFLAKIKWLTQMLIISGVLNIAFLATFAYMVLREKQTSVSFELKPVEQNQEAKNTVPTNEKVLSAYSQLSFQELILRLENKEHIEEGYTRRDLALACLTAFHHFNLEKALGGLTLTQRTLFFYNPKGEERVDVKVFPGLSDYQFQAIIHYTKTEKWPLTSQGLFFELKKAPLPKDPTLVEAFYMTPEFHMVATLFSRSGSSVSKELLLEMILQGEWSLLQEFAVLQRQNQDLSLQKRQSFLLNYLHYHSPIAAKLLLETDIEFSAKRLDDAQTILLLSLLNEPFSQLEKMLKELLCSQRSDLVLKKAAEKLYAFANEPLPDPFDYRLALARFAPHALPPLQQENAQVFLDQKKEEKTPIVSLPLKSKRVHIVQEGESLWKISRKYRVPVEAIKKANQLDSDRLRVGRKLEIPDQAK